MKRIICLITVFALVFSLSSCGSSSRYSSTANDGKPQKLDDYNITVKAKNCYKAPGYFCFITDAEGDYTVTVTGDSRAQFKIYVFSEEYQPFAEYIERDSTPSLEGSGFLHIKADAYVYVYCTINEFTAKIPDRNCKLSIEFTPTETTTEVQSSTE
ncbi:MAG: hypothetical protein K6F64_07925 [Clostridia bacterium]|nr:hypothetical protein [Clostridia bacterium]